jgi:hypothetical protein
MIATALATTQNLKGKKQITQKTNPGHVLD